MEKILNTVAYEYPYVGSWLATFGIVPRTDYGVVDHDHFHIQQASRQLAYGQSVTIDVDDIVRCQKSLLEQRPGGIWANKYVNQGLLMEDFVRTGNYCIKESRRMNRMAKVTEADAINDLVKESKL